MSAKNQIVGQWSPWSAAARVSLASDTIVLVELKNGSFLCVEVDRLNWNRDNCEYDIKAYAIVNRYVKPAWRAARGCEFWYVTTYGGALRWTEKFDPFCDQAYEAGNYYPTEELATAAAQRVLNAYKGGTP